VFAGDHQQFRALLLQVVHRAHRVVGHRGRRFRSVRKACRIAEIEIIGARNAFDERAEDGQPANAGVEDADGRPAPYG